MTIGVCKKKFPDISLLKKIPWRFSNFPGPQFFSMTSLQGFHVRGKPAPCCTIQINLIATFTLRKCHSHIILPQLYLFRCQFCPCNFTCMCIFPPPSNWTFSVFHSSSKILNIVGFKRRQKTGTFPTVHYRSIHLLMYHELIAHLLRSEMVRIIQTHRYNNDVLSLCVYAELTKGWNNVHA